MVTSVTGATLGETTAVGAESAKLAPALFVAVTPTRTVLPTSTDASVYVLPLAPMMSAQLPPLESQRRHWYENVIGCVPDQVPGFAVSVSPCLATPAIVGGDVLRGFAVTTAVGSEVATAEPTLFVALTVTRRVWPT